MLITVLFSFTCVVLYAQEQGNSFLKIRRNYIIANVGLMDYNFNYERNIIQSPKSFTNIKLSYGSCNDLQGGRIEYYAASIVHLFGQKNSHLEFNLGLNKFMGSLIPDIFVGYRYEKTYGIFIFRTGLSFPSVFSLGIGFKF